MISRADFLKAMDLLGIDTSELVGIGPEEFEDRPDPVALSSRVLVDREIKLQVSHSILTRKHFFNARIVELSMATAHKIQPVEPPKKGPIPYDTKVSLFEDVEDQRVMGDFTLTDMDGEFPEKTLADYKITFSDGETYEFKAVGVSCNHGLFSFTVVGDFLVTFGEPV